MQDSNNRLMAAWLQNLVHAAGDGSGPAGRADALAVCDSAFGAGHRFVRVWQAWQANPRHTLRLHYVGFEPLMQDAPQLALHWGGCDRSAESDALLSAWVTPLPGVSRLEFDGGRVSLTLLHMPLKQAVLQLMARIDVFLLDANIGHLAASEPGFSLFGQMARVAAAGALVQARSGVHHELVRRGLQRAGFVCEQAILPWVLEAGPGGQPKAPLRCVQARLRPGLQHTIRRALPDRCVAVIGGGIAGAGVARALALRGHDVHVFDSALAGSRQGRHAGHLGAAVTPAVSRDDDHRARLSRAGARLAWLRWQGLPARARPLKTGTAVVTPDPVEQVRLRDALQAGRFALSWARWCTGYDADEAAGLASGSPYAWFSEGMVMRPGALVEALLAHPSIVVHGSDVAQFAGASGQWQLSSADGRTLASVSNVVLANAAGVLPLLRASGLAPVPARLAQMQAIAGQISYFDASRFTTPVRCVLDGDGYWLPSVDGMHVGGGTYDLDAVQAQVTPAGHLQVIGKVCSVLGLGNAAQQDIDANASGYSRLAASVAGGWAGWRAVVPGRLPVIGEWPGCQGVWLACAYGSRGLTWSALAGEVIAATLNDEPLPIERDLLRAIAVR